MVNITLINRTGYPYSKVRDAICEHLAGNKAYVDNDIIVSDCNEDINRICFSLGSDNTPVIDLKGEITSIDL